MHARMQCYSFPPRVRDFIQGYFDFMQLNDADYRAAVFEQAEELFGTMLPEAVGPVALLRGKAVADVPVAKSVTLSPSGKSETAYHFKLDGSEAISIAEYMYARRFPFKFRLERAMSAVLGRTSRRYRNSIAYAAKKILDYAATDIS